LGYNSYQHLLIDWVDARALYWVLDDNTWLEPPMFMLLLRAFLLIPTLMAASLLFADELVVSALILITVTLAAVSLVIGPDGD